MKSSDFGLQEDKASLCFFASPHREGLLIWLIHLSIVKCPLVCATLGKCSRYGWAVSLMSIGNPLYFQSLPLIAFQLSNKIVIHWYLLRLLSEVVQYVYSLRAEADPEIWSDLVHTDSHPKVNYIGTYARELVAFQWPTTNCACFRVTFDWQ